MFADEATAFSVPSKPEPSKYRTKFTINDQPSVVCNNTTCVPTDSHPGDSAFLQPTNLIVFWGLRSEKNALFANYPRNCRVWDNISDIDIGKEEDVI